MENPYSYAPYGDKALSAISIRLGDTARGLEEANRYFAGRGIKANARQALEYLDQYWNAKAMKSLAPLPMAERVAPTITERIKGLLRFARR